MKKIFFLSLVSSLMLCADMFAANRYWVATSTANWNSTANWSTTSGVGSGASVPGSGDVAIFDGGGTGNCNIDATVNILGWSMTSGYTGTISQGTYRITVGTTGATLSGGTFSGGSANITFSGGACTISGTAFTNTSGNFSSNSNFTLSSGSFAHNNGTVKFTAGNTIAGTITFFHLTFTPTSAAAYSISNTITAEGVITIEGSSKVTLDNGTIQADSNVTVTNTSTSSTAGGTGTIVFTSNFDQSFTGSGTAGAGKLPNVTINKGGGTLSLLSIISVNGNWTYSGGTVSPGSSGVAFYGTYNTDGQASGTMPFYRVQISDGTRTLTGNLDCNDNLTILTGATLSASSYTINVGGNFINQGTWTYGSSTVVFDGTGYNRIQQTSGTITFANITFNRAAGKSVTLFNKVYVTTNATFILGRVKTTSTNILEFADDATCTMSNNDSAYVHGPVLKTGNDAFTFPLGDTTLHDSIAYHPMAITAPGSATDQFTATYYASAQAYGSAKASTLNSVSTTQYWLLDRVTGTSTPTVTLSWNRNGDNTAFSEMRVAEWTGAQWTDRGQASTSITNPTGSVTASAALSFGADPAPLVIAYAVVSKSYSVLHKSAPASGYATTDGNVLYFGFEDEYDDQNDSLSFSVVKLATDRVETLLATPANLPLVYYGSNRYKLDLYDDSNSPLASGYYMLEVTNSRNEKWYLRFKI